VLNYGVVLEDDELREQFGGNDPMVNGSIFLDLDDDGKLAYGPNLNIQLGQWREALGINEAGYSLEDAKERRALFTIKHRQDKEDPEIVYDQVSKVAPIE